MLDSANRACTAVLPNSDVTTARKNDRRGALAMLSVAESLLLKEALHPIPWYLPQRIVGRRCPHRIATSHKWSRGIPSVQIPYIVYTSGRHTSTLHSNQPQSNPPNFLAQKIKRIDRLSSVEMQTPTDHLPSRTFPPAVKRALIPVCVAYERMSSSFFVNRIKLRVRSCWAGADCMSRTPARRCLCRRAASRYHYAVIGGADLWLGTRQESKRMVRGSLILNSSKTPPPT